MQALHKNGLHEPFLASLIEVSSTVPSVIRDALDHVATLGATDYSGPKRVDLTYQESVE